MSAIWARTDKGAFCQWVGISLTNHLSVRSTRIVEECWCQVNNLEGPRSEIKPAPGVPEFLTPCRLPMMVLARLSSSIECGIVDSLLLCAQEPER